MSDFGTAAGLDWQRVAQDSMEQWRTLWQAASAAAPAAARPASTGFDNAAMARVLDGLKGYLAWLEQAAAAATPQASPWQASASAMFDGGPDLFAQAMGAFPGMDQPAWGQMPQGMAAPLQQAVDSMLGLPAFGLMRERQEQQQALGKAWIDWHQQSARYQQLIARTGKDAAERVQDKLAEHEEPGRQIDSMRGLYNLWVDAAEDAWAEVAMSAEYREIYAAMVNAQMRVRQLLQAQTADMAGQLGLPTRAEVDSIGKRLQEVRRELAGLKDNAAPSAAGRPPVTGTPAARKAPAAEQAVAGQPASKKPATTKPAKNKATAKKTASKKTSAKKPAAKKTTARKSTAKKPASTKSADAKRARKSTRKTAVRKAAARAGGGNRKRTS